MCGRSPVHRTLATSKFMCWLRDGARAGQYYVGIITTKIIYQFEGVEEGSENGYSYIWPPDSYTTPHQHRTRDHCPIMRCNFRFHRATKRSLRAGARIMIYAAESGCIPYIAHMYAVLVDIHCSIWFSSAEMRVERSMMHDGVVAYIAAKSATL